VNLTASLELHQYGGWDHQVLTEPLEFLLQTNIHQQFEARNLIEEFEQITYSNIQNTSKFDWRVPINSI
jgi:hypothetical protein